MKRKIVITYDWFSDNGGEIKPHHVEALEESAQTRITYMTNDGYTSGNLTDNIFMNDDDIENGEEGIAYSGQWELTIEDVE